VNDVMRRLIAVSITFMGPLCATTTAQSGVSWTQTQLIQRARAGALLENMAGRIRANSDHAEDYVGANIGAGPSQTCENAQTLAALDVCEWANLLRGAAGTQEEESAVQLNGARGCISRPSPSLYVISIAWEGAVLTDPPGANCDSGAFHAQRALLTVVRFAQDT
jgi:type IV pilus assembly protein PilV